MSTDLAVFENGTYNIRTVTIDGETWFVASDIAKALGYATARDMIRGLEDDEKGEHSVPTPGGTQSMSVISEPGLYRVLATARRDEVKPFQRWVYHEVLPAIRKTGQFAIEQHVTPKPLPSKFESVALAQYNERARRRRARELEARGLYENPVTGEILPLPGIVLEKDLKQVAEDAMDDRLRRARKSSDSPYETPADFDRHRQWQGNLGEM